jgi:hypothetical protein
MLRRSLRVATLALAVSLALGSCASSAPSGPLTPLVLGWERYFTLSWQMDQRRGKPVVIGKIYNNYGFAAANMRLLVDELDAGGQIVDQQVGWLGFTLTPGTTAPFEIPVAHATPNHRVSVFAFDWVQTDSRGFHRF